MDNAGIEILKKMLATRGEIEFAYLFGSHAKGTAGRLSDIDIAVYVREKTLSLKRRYPYGYKAALASDLMKILNTNDVDIVVLNEAKPFLRHQAIKYGMLLKRGNEELRISFWVDTLQRYDDAKRLMKIQHDCMKKRIDRGTFGV
ncbi:nucleotidyltransferase domain-containing protein [bacterium]|nr:MAG: nucleotidyltransferase domain-containing protein [bacterium]